MNTERPTQPTVILENTAFSPETIHVHPGQSVRWVNREPAPHTIACDAFHSGVLNEGDAFERVFDQPGTYRYYCELHPMMGGSVVVEEY